jgi:microcystin-dependent protein
LKLTFTTTGGTSTAASTSAAQNRDPYQAVYFIIAVQGDFPYNFRRLEQNGEDEEDEIDHEEQGHRRLSWVPFAGEIMMFAGRFVPRGWAPCDGQLLSINSYQNLFSVIGASYGGDGRTTFAVPDLRGRAPVHSGTGPGLGAIRMGSQGGSASLAAHTHAFPASCDADVTVVV